MYDITKINNDLKNALSSRRYEHSINVANCAKKLAKHYNIDEEKAYIAGMVHDIAKEFNIDENKKWIEKYNLSNELLEPEFEKIVHANIGAVVIKELYNLDDDICNAVLYHTVGNISMSLLDKIIYVADKIARDPNPTVDTATKLAYEDIDKAMIFLLKTQQEKLLKNGKNMDNNSIELLNYLKNKYN